MMPVEGGRWLGPCDVGEVGALVACSELSAKKQPEEGYGGEYERWEKGARYGRPDMEVTASRLVAAPPFPPLAVWQGGADRLVQQLPGRLDGWVCFCDPPYKGDGSRKITGYPHGDFSREDTLRLATELHRRGAVVAVSECVGLARELGEGWEQVEISHGRKGQVRSMSVEQREFLTVNRPPQWRPHLGQQGLFGGSQ